MESISCHSYCERHFLWGIPFINHPPTGYVEDTFINPALSVWTKMASVMQLVDLWFFLKGQLKYDRIYFPILWSQGQVYNGSLTIECRYNAV